MRTIKKINTIFIVLVVTAIFAVMLSAFLFSSPRPAFGESALADYMFILKDGSTVAASINEKLLSDTSVKIIKLKTAYGELEVPRGEVIKYYKSSENSKANAKTPQSDEKRPQSEITENNKTAQKTETANTTNSNAKLDAKNDTIETQNEVLKIEEVEEGVITGNKGPKPKTNADGLLNLDDDRLLDMLGESDAKPPKPVISSDEKKIEEIEKVSEKYQSKKDGSKKLLPDNLSSIETDIKAMAQSSTEEDWLVAKFTKEIQLEKSGTVPVEIVEVVSGKDDPKKGNEKNEKNEKKEKENGPKKAKKGTGEVSLSGNDDIIISETVEAEIIGGGKLSEKIGKEFKKHKAFPTRKVSEKSHLKTEIEKHFAVKEETPAETGEVKMEKPKKNKIK